MTSKSKCLGFFLALTCAFIWTISSFFTKYLQSALHFKGIFIFTYLSASMFSLNFLLLHCISTGSKLGRFVYTAQDQQEIEDQEGEDQDYLNKNLDGGGQGTKNLSSLLSCVNKEDHQNPTCQPWAEANDLTHTQVAPKVQGALKCKNSLLAISSDSSSNDYEPIKIIETGACYLSRDMRDENSPKRTEEAVLNEVERCTYDTDNSLLGRLVKPIPEKYTTCDLILASVPLLIFWFMGTFFYNCALAQTSIGSAVVIFNSNAAFTLVFSYTLGIEEITFSKIVGILLNFAGVILVSVEEIGPSRNKDGYSIYGDIMAFLGAIGYALYTVALNIKMPRVDSKLSLQVFGYFGLVASIGLSPILIYFIVCHTGSIGDLTPFIFVYIVIEEIFDGAVANYLYAKATFLTSPTVTAVSLTLTVPCAIAADYFYEGIEPSSCQIFGAFMVTVGIIFFVPIEKGAVRKKRSCCLL